MRNAGRRNGTCRPPRARQEGPDNVTELYRQLFNKELYLLAYGRIYANQGAMTPGARRRDRGRHVRGEDERNHRGDAPRALPLPRQPGGCSSRKRTGRCGRWACRHGQISWSARWSRLLLEAYYEPSSFLTARTGSGKGAGATPRVRTRKSCERAWQIAGVDSSRADAGDCPEWGQPGARGGVAQARRSPGLAVQGRNRSRAGPVRGFPPLCLHWSR